MQASSFLSRDTELRMGWVDPRVGSIYLAFWWVGLRLESETFTKIIKLGRPISNLIMINTDK